MTLTVIVGAVGAVLVVLLVVMRMAARSRPAHCELQHTDGNRRLIVLVHGLLGRSSFQSAISLAAEAMPGSDLLIADYDSRVLSNASPYAIANVLERQIHEAFVKHAYDEIVLVGHSLGGSLLRKALVWGNGLEEDRTTFGLRGERKWVERVSRVVSLAAINRGWSIEPRPQHMDAATFWSIWIGERFARLTGTGQLVLAVRKGSPFVADARVQWISLCRGHHPSGRTVPQTIHLLGDRDDIVSKDDGMDLIAAKDTIFVTLQETGHREIGAALGGGTTQADADRREKVKLAMQGRLNELEPDAIDTLTEDLQVQRVVYIMHGIRDYGEWTDRLRTVIEQESKTRGLELVVVNQKYGHFPMLPFLLYWDRQRNVRRFMDEYTENRARFPRARTFDYVGHSNGTYILASALQNYKTLEVGRVFFAGSVVPKHYAWVPLADDNRVVHVANVVAAGDWVVALFPRFFEQIAEWRGLRPHRGLLDIGSAGFRGFEDAKDAKKRIENFQFAAGQHGTGVDARNSDKLTAIARYIVGGDTAALTLFRNQDEPNGRLAFLSNVCWLVWAGLGAAVVGFGFFFFWLSPVAGWAFVVVVLGLLNSV